MLLLKLFKVKYLPQHFNSIGNSARLGKIKEMRLCLLFLKKVSPKLVKRYNYNVSQVEH
jgi:hypothetical protein